jgi:hypothetical protein
MKADAYAGEDCELVPPSSRYWRKTLKHRVAGGECCTGTRPLWLSNPESRHHSVTGDMEHFAAEGHGNPREDGEKFIEQTYDSCGRQLLGNTGISPHIGE